MRATGGMANATDLKSVLTAKTFIDLTPVKMPMPLNAEGRLRRQRILVAERRKGWFSRYDSKCTRCGSSDKLVCHHADPDKKVSHHIWIWRDERREPELSKCIPLCYSCHRIVHGQVEKHGTRSRYKRGCRCDPCKRAKSIEKKRWTLRQQISRVLVRDTCHLTWKRKRHRTASPISPELTSRE